MGVARSGRGCDGRRLNQLDEHERPFSARQNPPRRVNWVQTVPGTGWVPILRLYGRSRRGSTRPGSPATFNPPSMKPATSFGKASAQDYGRPWCWIFL
jgi:hypothetical protein